jgi:hypothetical protein
MFLEARHKLGISITNDKLWHPLMLDPHVKNNLAKSKVVVIVLVGTIFTNLDNRSTTTKMASIPFHSSSWFMNSMDTLSHGLLGIDRGLYNPISHISFCI